jgi:hypothetical protein
MMKHGDAMATKKPEFVKAKAILVKRAKPLAGKKKGQPQEAGKPNTPDSPEKIFRRVAKPDAFDERDREFRPNVSVTPKAAYYPGVRLEVKNQGETNACTGFALSTVVEYLLKKSDREPQAAISPFMLYSMARRYDEFPGSSEDSGSSLRGALKGWFKHGACAEKLFPAFRMPAATAIVGQDWWLDAVTRPLGAYFRIDKQCLTDMHAALNEVGVIYASAGCHPGWDKGFGSAPDESGHWAIPSEGEDLIHPGHAFAIVGYTELGFIVHNSWGDPWGTKGLALLQYDDWLRNAMDCWVLQLGVVTREHEAIAKSATLRTDKQGRVALAAGKVLRNREISPFIVNMGNNGLLSNSGAFRTTPDDVRAILDVQLAGARTKWKLENKPIDVCVYMHGGLVGEDSAAEAAAEWIPLLYENQIFPIFLMWETDFISTVMNILSDAVKQVPRATGGIGEKFEKWWNARLERWLARPGTVIWGEMKQNAKAMSTPTSGVAEKDQAGAVILYEHFQKQGADKNIRLHLVGHSAGSIVASYFVDQLIAAGTKIESMSFMAPAVRVETFEKLVVPHLNSGDVKRYQQFHLSEQAEQDDPTCGPYRRSLLYLVSESFEGGTTTPILGMKRFFDQMPTFPVGKVHVSPGPADAGNAGMLPVASSTHGGFDNDKGTQREIVKFVKGT